MNIEWNKAVRRTLLLPYKTRTCLLPHLIHGKPFFIQHRSRISNFLISFTASDNSCVFYIGERTKSYSHGTLWRNSTRCRGRKDGECFSTELVARAFAISELMDVKDGISVLPGMSPNDIESMIDSICCN